VVIRLPCPRVNESVEIKQGEFEMSNLSKKQISLIHAREMRKSPTEAESLLWRRLRKHQIKDVHFRRQHPIGEYIVDFCAPLKKLVIEVDGGYHASQADFDSERTAYLVCKEYRVLRFSNAEIVENIEQVIRSIKEAIGD